MPTLSSQLVEAFLVRHQYDAVISWAERLGLPFAAMLKATGSATAHVAIASWISKPKKAWLLKRVHTHIDRLVTGSSRQRDFAVRVIGMPPHKVKHLPLYVDQRFFRPIVRDTDMICAAGREMRDYPTLVDAVAGLDLRCHIAAGPHRGKLERWVKSIDPRALPPTISVGKLSYVELREVYARSKFVVVPLLETDTDNGVTTILEAMAMGKAVICSRTVGQVDVLEDGVTGIFVPPGDAVALRQAIEFLRRRPSVAARMGLAGRKRIEERHTIDNYMTALRGIVEDAIAERTDRVRTRTAAANRTQPLSPGIRAVARPSRGSDHDNRLSRDA
jgi:glycosyltransferase involved in cell wall biosynthesis